MPEFLTEAVPNERAIEFIATKPAVHRQVFDRLLPELKARAFSIAGVEALDTIQNVRDLVSRIPAGEDWDKTKRRLRDELSPHMTTQGAKARAELLLRMHGHQAYSVAQHEVMVEQQEDFPYWEYLSMGDGKVRDSHEALDGLILRSDDPFWQDHYPPWEWNCRCQVIPVSGPRHDQLLERDKELPGDKRKVLTDDTAGPIRDRLHAGELARDGKTVNVASPEQRGGSYRFDPATLRMDLEGLRERYDPDVWREWEKWANDTEIPETGLTVAEWVDGAETMPEGNRDLTMLHAGETAIVQDEQIKEIARDALMEIDNVHLVPAGAPHVPVVSKAVDGRWGQFVWNKTTLDPIRIELDPNGPWPRLTALHEYGHYMSLVGLGEPGQAAGRLVPQNILSGWWDVVTSSKEFQSLSKTLPAHHRKWLNPEEMWARSYAQYIATKSGSERILADVEKVRSQSQYPDLQWTNSGFRPILKAIDAVIGREGLKR